jgi:1-acyl-sn-glycerol-3-phosphate acyltransferase
MFHVILNHPIFILKKELTWIPIFGQYLVLTRMIVINRNGATKALRSMLTQIKDRVKEQYPIILFPEGTRVKPGETKRLSAGAYAVYKENLAPMIPVSLNTGIFWSKNSFLKKPGKYIIEFCPPLKTDLSKSDFNKILQKEISIYN